jgi:TPR repeat protein
VLFNEAIEKFDYDEDLEEQFHRFERAAVKGHEESIWIVSVVKDAEMESSALREAFAKTEEPLGWYFAGLFSNGREAFDFYKKSAEGGCSWGQVEYGEYFKYGDFVEKDEKIYVEWLEKAAKQNNPQAMRWLGYLFRYEGGDNKEKAVSYFRAAAELGWKYSMFWLAHMLRDGEGCVKDLRQAVIWGAKGNDSYLFRDLLRDAKRALESRRTNNLDCDFNQLCYTLGWGLYWYQRGSEYWNRQVKEVKVFGNRCLDYYCSCVELQQKSIFTFLLCWNRMTGVKGPGQMIAQMVWEGREDNLVQTFEEINGQEPETKRIKK